MTAARRLEVARGARRRQGVVVAQVEDQPRQQHHRRDRRGGERAGGVAAAAPVHERHDRGERREVEERRLRQQARTEQEPRERVLVRRLAHHRISGSNRRRDLPCHQQQWKIERGDARHDAEGLLADEVHLMLGARRHDAEACGFRLFGERRRREVAAAGREANGPRRGRTLPHPRQ